MAAHFQIIPSTSLATPITSAGFAVDDATQLIVEVYPSGLTGTLSVYLEFSNAATDGMWFPETVDDVGGGAVVGNAYNIPVRQSIRTWTANTPFQIATPCGYHFVRVTCSASDATGTVFVYLNKVTNRGG